MARMIKSTDDSGGCGCDACAWSDVAVGCATACGGEAGNDGRDGHLRWTRWLYVQRGSLFNRGAILRVRRGGLRRGGDRFCGADDSARSGTRFRRRIGKGQLDAVARRLDWFAIALMVALDGFDGRQRFLYVNDWWWSFFRGWMYAALRGATSAGVVGAANSIGGLAARTTGKPTSATSFDSGAAAPVATAGRWLGIGNSAGAATARVGHEFGAAPGCRCTRTAKPGPTAPAMQAVGGVQRPSVTRP